jgi:hypothetical protein
MSSSLTTTTTATTPLTEAEIQDLVKKLVAALDKVTDQAKQQQLEKEIKALIYRLDNFLVTEETKVRQQVEAQARQHAQVIIDQANTTAQQLMQQAQHQADTTRERTKAKKEMQQLYDFDLALNDLYMLFEQEVTRVSPAIKTKSPISTPPKVPGLTVAITNALGSLKAQSKTTRSTLPVPQVNSGGAVYAQQRQLMAMKNQQQQKQQQQQQQPTQTIRPSVSTTTPNIPQNPGGAMSFLASIKSLGLSQNGNSPTLQQKPLFAPVEGFTEDQVRDIFNSTKTTSAVFVENTALPVPKTTVPPELEEYIQDLINLIKACQDEIRELRYKMNPKTFALPLAKLQAKLDKINAVYQALSNIPYKDLSPEQQIMLSQFTIVTEKLSDLVTQHPDIALQANEWKIKELDSNKVAYETIKDEIAKGTSALIPEKVKQFLELIFNEKTSGIATWSATDINSRISGATNIMDIIELRALYYYLSEITTTKSLRAELDNVGVKLRQILLAEKSNATEFNGKPLNRYVNDPRLQNKYKPSSTEMKVTHDAKSPYHDFIVNMQRFLDLYDDNTFIPGGDQLLLDTPIKPAKLRGTRVTTFSS